MLLKDFPPHNFGIEDLSILRAGILHDAHERLRTAHKLDVSLGSSHETSDRFAISVGNRRQERIREACSRLLLRPRRKGQLLGDIDALVVYLPDSTSERGERPNRIYVRQIDSQRRRERFLITKSQIASYTTIEDIEPYITDEGGIEYHIPEERSLDISRELEEAALLKRMIDPELPDSYYLKTQNIRL